MTEPTFDFAVDENSPEPTTTVYETATGRVILTFGVSPHDQLSAEQIAIILTRNETEVLDPKN